MMLTLRALEIVLLSPLLLTFAALWRAYFVLNSTAHARRVTKKDRVQLRNRTLNHSPRPTALLAWALPPFCLLSLYFLTFHSFEGLAFYRHLHLSNFSLGLCVYLLLIGNLAHWWLAKALARGRYKGLSLDYLTSLALLLFYLPFIVLANTALTLFFFLELASTLILYNFATSQSWAGLTRRKAQGGQAAQTLATSKYFFNVIFFQFWASFFSSALIVYAIINLYLLFGTTEWFYLNFLANVAAANGRQAPLALRLTVLILALGFVLKLGIAPFFAYKVEIYRGLPLYALFFYSVVYFVTFFTAALVLFTYYFAVGGSLLKPLVVGALCLACLVLVLFMFDSQALRNFFALSSLVNATNFLMLIFA